MHVEHEAADRHRRDSGNSRSARPSRRSGSCVRRGRKAVEQVERVLRAQAACSASSSRSGSASRLGVAAPGQRVGEHRRAASSFVSGVSSRMVGDVVGGADEAIEGQDRPRRCAREQPRGDREVLVPVALAGRGPRSPSSRAPCLPHRRLGAALPHAATPAPVLSRRLQGEGRHRRRRSRAGRGPTAASAGRSAASAGTRAPSSAQASAPADLRDARARTARAAAARDRPAPCPAIVPASSSGE